MHEFHEKKILYAYVYHVVGYLGKCEALHEITDFVHEMLSVCAPLRDLRDPLRVPEIVVEKLQRSVSHITVRKDSSLLASGGFISRPHLRPETPQTYQHYRNKGEVASIGAPLC